MTSTRTRSASPTTSTCLREVVHLGCGWLALEPRLEVKCALGDHLHDDARSISKIKRRLYELRTPSDYPGAPSEELSALLDRAAGARDAADISRWRTEPSSRG
jgi:hypothetical protein